ncbi:MAG TPA: threonine/serine dehydratase [Alphaproteobacteria bacterium]|nr:threonine/serine dehydratase [Alphaproteobacteria bacterium]
MSDLPTIDDVRAAAGRIAPHVRRTPLLPARPVHEAPGFKGELLLKLESLQVTGSFKARGAMSKATALDEDAIRRGLITASGGNHGLGVAYAGWAAGAPVRIYLPHNTPPAKAEKLKAWGAEVVMHGAVWDDANAAAMEAAEAEGLTYVHPFADPQVIAGQGTVVLELAGQDPAIDTLVVAIGGGGLISGVSLAAKALNPAVRVIGVEPEGAPTLSRSLEAGRLVELPGIETAANTLAPRRSAALNLELIGRNVDEIVLVSDAEMRQAARWLWFEFGIGAELAGAASLAALIAGRLRPPAGSRVAALVCGAGTDGIG